MKEWLKDAIFYQVYPSSFMDKNEDGCGDLKGITSKLDYIKDLGCNAIWINPVFVSPFKDGGYDISDYEHVDPRFGKNEDLQEQFSFREPDNYYGNYYDDDKVMNDLKKSIQTVGSNTAYCFPFYAYSDHAIDLVKEAGFKLGFIGGDRKTTRSTDKYKIPRYHMYDLTPLGNFVSMIA